MILTARYKINNSECRVDPTTRVPAGRLQAYLNCEIIRLNEQLDENVEEKVIQIVTGDDTSIHPEDRS